MSFIIVILGIVYNRDLANIAIIVGMFLTPAAALKGYQKTQEVKSESKD
jgi:hypothetical protein